MRTTLNFPDDLIRQAKIRAAREGTTLTEIIVSGLTLAVQGTKPRRELPVSQAVGGLVKGVDWKSLHSSDRDGEVYR